MNKKVNIYLADDLHPNGIKLLENKYNVFDVKGFANNILLKKISSLAKINSGINSKTKSALMIRSVRNIDRRFIKSISDYTDISLICTVSSGYDNIDLVSCRKYKIDVMNVAGANSTSAAEFTVAVILAAAKNIIEANKDMKNHIFDYSKFKNNELSKKTLGIIGYGRIGSKVAKYAKAFNMDILANDIDPAVKRKHSSVKFVSLIKLLSSSDFITIHTPLNSTSKYLINSKNISLIQSHAVLVNCSRGGTVEEKALIKALSNNKLYYSAIDVFEEEPEFNIKFTKLKNVLLTPHLAGKTVESKQRMGIEAAKKVAEYFSNSHNKHKLIN